MKVHVEREGLALGERSTCAGVVCGQRVRVSAFYRTRIHMDRCRAQPTNAVEKLMSTHLGDVVCRREAEAGVDCDLRFGMEAMADPAKANGVY